MSTKKKMETSEVCFGTWLASGSPVIAELAVHCCFDWLLLDMEHGCLHESSVFSHLQILTGRGTAIVVRTSTHEAGLIGRLLDWGADAIMVPHVSSAEEAEALVRAMRYPPAGTRGFSRSVRACEYGLNLVDASQHTSQLFAQIENYEGVMNIEEIARVEGVDTLFVGPADLQLSLDVSNAPFSIDEAFRTVVEAAKKNNKHAGILLRKPEDLSAILAMGFDRIALNSDLSMLRQGLLLTRQQCRDAEKQFKNE